MEKEKKYFALIDIGGTYTKIKVLAFENLKYRKKLQEKKLIKNKKELIRFLKISLKNFSPIECAIFSIAGPVLNEKMGLMTNWEGNPFINTNEFKEKLNIKELILLNDMEAQGYGLISLKEKNLLYDKCKIIYSPEKFSKNLNMVLIVPGTGLGSCAIINNYRIIPLELQHSTFYPFDNKIKKIIEISLKENIFPSFESFVSGEGIFNTFLKLKKIKGEDFDHLKIKNGAEFVNLKAKKGEGEALLAMDIYFYVLALYSQATSLSFKPFSGIFIGGKAARKNQIFFKRKTFLKTFFQNKKQMILLKKIPLFFIDKELIFEGLFYFLKKQRCDKIFKTKRRKEMKKYRCTVCGYIYDPENGDPDNGIAPGTLFEDLPDDWVCPICGVGKDQFVSD